jgi:hypothetical protein
MNSLVKTNPSARGMMMEKLTDALIDADDAARGAPTTEQA